MFFWAIAVFIVYGSLFPFDFQPTSKSFQSFLAEWHLFTNRADAVDNFFLFVPLGAALHAGFKSARGRWIAAVFSVLVLGVGIQLVQLYLPSRTASVSDFAWNSLGLLTGFLVATWVWRVIGGRLSPGSLAHDYFAMQLVALWFFYESFPFVPTLDVSLLREHVKSVVFAPPFDAMRLLQHGLAATLASMALARVSWFKSPTLGLALVGGVAFFLEVFVAYGSLRRETLLGMALGLLSGHFFHVRLKHRGAQLFFVIAFCMYALTVFLPYRNQPADGGFTLTPFSGVFWRGITKDLPPVAFESLAIGSMLWAGLSGTRRFEEYPLLWIACVLALLVLFEGVRVYAMGLHGDTTPLVVALILAPVANALRRKYDSQGVTNG